MQNTPPPPASGAARPLEGVTVVEICHSIAGPYGAGILAQLGADVIKVENPDRGDDARAWGPPNWGGASTLFQAINRDKCGLAIDLKDEEGRDALRRLILERADVVIQNMRPGAIDRLGLGAAELLAIAPRLIYCNIGAFGSVGPLSGKPGYDPLMQAQGGLMSVTGEASGGPVRIGTSLVDMGAGMWATIGVLAALSRRSATGLGGVVDTSLFETSLAWMGVHVAGHLVSGEIRRPMGSGVAEIVPHQAFRTSDGYVMVAAGNDSLFGKLVSEMQLPELAQDPRFRHNFDRVDHRDELIPVLSRRFAQHATAHWRAALDRAGVPVAPLQNIAEVIRDPQTLALGMIQSVPDKNLSLMGLPLRFDGVRPECQRAAPTLGEHNTLLRRFTVEQPL
ncbi:MAG: CoA transferase [Burkholderiaceae bacterium]|nr:CoA transferase [Burkholderiaceae bacterium]